MESEKRKNHWGSILVIIGLTLFSCSTEPAIPAIDKGVSIAIDSALLDFYSAKDSFLFTHTLNVLGVRSTPLLLDTNFEYHAELRCFTNGMEQNTKLNSLSNFYIFTNSIEALQSNNLQITTTDVDKQDLALGLKSTWITSTITSDSLQVEINGWYYDEAVKGLKVPTGVFFATKLPVTLK
jgi:hypothetical protein